MPNRLQVEKEEWRCFGSVGDGEKYRGGESVSINVRGKDKKRSYRCAIMLSCKCHNDNGRALSTAATTLFKLWPLLV